MSKSLSTVMLGLGVLVLVCGLIAHFAFHGQILPHFSLILGAVAVIVLGIGAYGYFGQSATR